MNIALIIPSRLGSTRLKDKPLLKISGVCLIDRVVSRAQTALIPFPNVSLHVACDDERIASIAQSAGADVIMGTSSIPTGTDRVYHAAWQMQTKPDYIINLQGDAPFMPIAAIQGLIQLAIDKNPPYTTAVSRLSWQELSDLRQHKKHSPSSGTTAIVVNGKALWFSKNILPHIRNEKQFQKDHDNSPVYRHFGIYGYTYAFLEQYISWDPGHYEQFEALEQLRAIENGHNPEVIILDNVANESYLSIDTPLDVTHAERYLSEIEPCQE